MKYFLTIVFSIICISNLYTQPTDTLLILQPISKYDTLTFTRIIHYDENDSLFYVRDYFENGQIQMQGTYSSIDKYVKENYWCNYKTNIKQGFYQTWYKNGNQESRYNFVDGKKNGLCEEFYPNGQISEKGYWSKGDIKGNSRGMRHGNFKGWSKEGQLLYDDNFEKGLKINPIDTNYQYMIYKPLEYESDTSQCWPLIIYLHGGSQRGTDLRKLYSSGIPDQIYRGREFPFIIVAPQCPVLIRWSTDNWFENFFEEITSKYRVDTDRVYLTGNSLGGSGTWYLGIKYPDKFAAIAPICGFTSHMDYIDQNIDNLINTPIWAFHGRIDKTVPFEETQRMIKKLKGRNMSIKFTAMPDVGHWISWLVYPDQEIYDWFLKYSR